MALIDEIRSCTICHKFLPNPPKPILAFSKHSKIIIIGQAPGVRVYESGIPWNDPSGERLRQWLNVSKEEFYDTNNFAIVPMGFCYPGNDGKGDKPPRPECAQAWMDKIQKQLKNKQLTILIGQYAQKYFLRDENKKTLTDTVKCYQDYLPEYFVLPHPSPRNNIWLKKNPWFQQKTILELQKSVKVILE